MSDAHKAHHSPAAHLRTTPSQERSLARVEKILSGAARIVANVGVSHLTTASVAREAGSSIGTIYRYFPDTRSLILALDERNVRALRRLTAQSLSRTHTSWQSAFLAMARALVTAYRSMPSFREIRIHSQLLAYTRIERDEYYSTLADEALLTLTQQPGFRLTESAKGSVRRAYAIVDSLLAAAFRHDASGDPELIRAALRFGLMEAQAAFVNAGGTSTVHARSAPAAQEDDDS